MKLSHPFVMDVVYDPIAGTFTMSKGSWKNTYPISDLPKWLDFYRTQQVMFPRYASHYQDSVDALEKLTADLQANGSTHDAKR